MKKYLYPIWGALYVLCAWLGMIPERSSTSQVILTVISVLFFVPGYWMLGEAIVAWDKKQLKVLRLISGLILGLTTLALAGNILSIMGSVTLGNVLHYVLALVSAPMMCCQNWFVVLFLWAVLFVATFPRLWGKQSKKP